MQTAPSHAPPSAPGLPLVGDAFAMAGDIGAFFTRQYLRLGPVFRVRALHRSFTVLAGPEDVIRRARRLRGRLGIASIHQEGLFAAMALEALETNIEDPHLDNCVAGELAWSLARHFESELAVQTPQTNIILLDVLTDLTAAEFCRRLAARGVLAKPRSVTRTVRLVVNRGSREHDLGRVIESFAGALKR